MLPLKLTPLRHLLMPDLLRISLLACRRFSFSFLLFFFFFARLETQDICSLFLKE